MKRLETATVSIIIPAFNYGRFIARTIESVQAQTLTDWECLVVDDGSTDDTGEVVALIAANDPRVKYLRQPNAGLGATRNAGLRATSGEFVQFLDADDLFGPRKLERQAEILRSHPEVDLVYGDARYFREATPDSPRVEWDRPLSTVSGAGEPLLSALLVDNIMVVQASLTRRPLLERVGGFDPSLPRLEDWDCWIRCALTGAVFLYDSDAGPDCLSYVRVHRASMSSDSEAMLRTAVVLRAQIHESLPVRLRSANIRRIHQSEAELGLREALGRKPRQGAVKLLKLGVTERHVRWLVLGCAVPFLRLRPGIWALKAWRKRRASARDSLNWIE